MKSSAQETAGWALVALAAFALPLLVLDLGLDAPPLRILFGWGAFLVVPALVAGGLGLVLADRRQWRIRWIPVACAEVLFLCLLGLSHISSSAGLADALLGQGGGLMGWGISGFLLQFLPPALVWLVLILIVAAALVGLLLSLPPDWIRVPMAAGGLADRLRDRWRTLVGGLESPASASSAADAAGVEPPQPAPAAPV
ncbi:MAG: DNA translocase FtsK 4TM domain-containing protein, partial [Nitrososphaerales archaeon]